MAIHGAGIAGIVITVRRVKALAGLEAGTWMGDMGVIARIVVVGLLLAVLHGIECALWAAAYIRFGALASPADAIL
jgi:hypothetical protein